MATLIIMVKQGAAMITKSPEGIATDYFGGQSSSVG